MGSPCAAASADYPPLHGLYFTFYILLSQFKWFFPFCFFLLVLVGVVGTWDLGRDYLGGEDGVWLAVDSKASQGLAMFNSVLKSI